MKSNIKFNIENNIFSLVQIGFGLALIFGFTPQPWHLITLGVYWLFLGVVDVVSHWTTDISKKASKEFKQEID